MTNTINFFLGHSLSTTAMYYFAVLLTTVAVLFQAVHSEYIQMEGAHCDVLGTLKALRCAL